MKVKNPKCAGSPQLRQFFFRISARNAKSSEKKTSYSARNQKDLFLHIISLFSYPDLHFFKKLAYRNSTHHINLGSKVSLYPPE